MKKHVHRGWFASIVLVVLAIVSSELDNMIPMSRSHHHVIIAASLILILTALANLIYQPAKATTKRSKHAWWLDDN